MSESARRRPGTARTAVGAAAVSVLALVWSHAFAALPGLGTPPPESYAAELSAVAVGLGLVVTVLSRGGRAWITGAVAGLVASVVMFSVAPGAHMATLSPIPVSMAIALVAERLVRSLPSWLDDALRRHRLRSGLWLLGAVLAVVQMARLSNWMTDPGSDWYLSTTNPFWAKHECLPAYVYGAEMALSGEHNIYAAAHYPALHPEAKPESAFAGMTIEDPYQYLPQFLIWPLLLGLGKHYSLMKLLWFATQTTAFLALASALARFVGGAAGRAALVLLPLALSAFPMLHDLQYGQFHLAAVMLAVAAMIAFHAGHNAVGGSAMAIAVLSKIFPGILLVVLLAQRRYRALGWTAVAALGLTALSLAVFGTAPYAAFVDYHLPRLQSGAAFAFGEAWPEIRELVIADNQGVFGFVTKLAAMGVPGVDEAVAAWVNRAYSVGLVALAWLVGARTVAARGEENALTWLGLVGLASMMSTGAFGDYVPVTATWLATILAVRMRDPRVAAWLGPAWIFQYTLLGTTPLGEWFEPSVMIPLSAVAVVMLGGIFVWSVSLGLRRARVARDESVPREAMVASG